MRMVGLSSAIRMRGPKRGSARRSLERSRCIMVGLCSLVGAARVARIASRIHRTLGRRHAQQSRPERPPWRTAVRSSQCMHGSVMLRRRRASAPMDAMDAMDTERPPAFSMGHDHHNGHHHHRCERTIRSHGVSGAARGHAAMAGARRALTWRLAPPRPRAPARRHPLRTLSWRVRFRPLPCRANRRCLHAPPRIIHGIHPRSTRVSSLAVPPSSTSFSVPAVTALSLGIGRPSTSWFSLRLCRRWEPASETICAARGFAGCSVEGGNNRLWQGL